MNRIIDPSTKKDYSIFEAYGKSILKKYIKLYQNGGSEEGGVGKDEQHPINPCRDIDRIYPCEILSSSPEHHNEPIQPLLIQDKNIRVFKARDADNEIKLMELFRNINTELERYNIMDERLGVVNIQPYTLNHNGIDYTGSSWEFIDGQKLEKVDITDKLKNNLHLLEAVSKIIGLTDLHNDNVLISNDIPYCIDGEVFEINLNKDHDTLLGQPMTGPRFKMDIKLVHKFMLKLLRNQQIYDLLNWFRKKLDNFRVLMGGTDKYMEYAQQHYLKMIKEDPANSIDTINKIANMKEDKIYKELQNKENSVFLKQLKDFVQEKSSKFKKYEESTNWYEFVEKVLNTPNLHYTKKPDQVSLKEAVDDFKDFKNKNIIYYDPNAHNQIENHIKTTLTNRLTSFEAKLTDISIEDVMDVINRTIAQIGQDYVPIYIYKNGQLIIPYSILDNDNIGDVSLGYVKKPDPIFIPEKLRAIPKTFNESESPIDSVVRSEQPAYNHKMKLEKNLQYKTA